MLTDGPLTLDRKDGKSSNTRIFCLNGPLILRNLFEFQAELREKPPSPLTIIDLSGVPYMDSAGMGLLMNQYVRCQTRGAKLIVSGANNRVMDLFKITRVDTILSLASSIEEADTDA